MPATHVSSGMSCRRRAEALPGVTSVAFADGLPPNNVGNLNNFDLEQHPTPTGQSQPVTPWVAVTADYVRTLGLTLLEGRLLDERDAEQDDLLSIMVDRAWARRFFPNESAVGKRLREGGCTTCPWTTVVGVVSEVKYAGLDRPDEGTVYTPLAGGTSRFVVVRTAGDPRTIAAPLRQVIRQLEPSAPLSDVATMDMLVDAVARTTAVAVVAGHRLCDDRAAPVRDRRQRRHGRTTCSSISGRSAFAWRWAAAGPTSPAWSSARAWGSPGWESSPAWPSR